MRVRLKTNFIDYYDHFFEVTNTEATLSRCTTDGPNRMDMFVLLDAMGFQTPQRGFVRDIYNGMVGGATPEEQTLLDEFQVVVYTDLQAHCGEGKEKMSIRQAFEKHPDAFASVWLRTSSQKQTMAQSLRMLMVGRKAYWLLYRSSDDWRSNAGTVEITQAQVPFKNAPMVDHLMIPLFAVDFLPVGGNWSNLVAVDLNVAPGIKGTPVQKLLQPEDAAALIKDRMIELKNG